MNHKAGFTLIEVIVVLAVVAILAAILVPSITKNINDSKIARATNEAQVIAAAIASFYKDTGRWPTADGTAGLADSLRLLYGPGDLPTAAVAPADAGDWLNTGAWSANADTFTHHLIDNNPGGGAVDYPNDATVPKPELRWRGPYIGKITADPWGAQYMCNIWYTYNITANNMVGIFSAGPNRIVETSPTQTASTYTVGGDDILFSFK